MRRLIHPFWYIGLGAVCMILAGVLLVVHIHTIVEVRDVSVPLVGQIPQMERQLAVLTQQLELTELHAAVRTGSNKEKIEVYALPNKTDTSRVIATLEVISDALKRDGLLAKMSSIEISDPVLQEDGSTAQRISLKFSAHENGLATLLLLVRLSGLLTIGDIVPQEDIDLLVETIEQENPSGIIALEQFLMADVLQYASNPKAFEEQLKRSFRSTAFLNAFESIVRTSVLRDIKIVLGGDIGDVIRSYKLWPMQMMSIDTISLVPGKAPQWQMVDLTLLALSRTE